MLLSAVVGVGAACVLPAAGVGVGPFWWGDEAFLPPPPMGDAECCGLEVFPPFTFVCVCLVLLLDFVVFALLLDECFMLRAAFIILLCAPLVFYAFTFLVQVVYRLD